MKTALIYSFVILLSFVDACSRTNFTKKEHQVIMHRDGGTLSLQVISNNILHVMYAPGKTLPNKKELAVVAKA